MIKKIKSLFSKSDDLEKYEIFINLLKNYLENYYPKILFDFSNKNRLQKEFNLDLQKSFLIESLIKQFIEFDYKKITQNSVKRELTWEGYGLNSTPNKKVPNDFIRRKEIIFLRDKQICNRCGNKIEKVNQAYISFIKDVEFGGGYNVENLALICVDCNQVLSNKDKAYKDILLPLKDKLYKLLG